MIYTCYDAIQILKRSGIFSKFEEEKIDVRVYHDRENDKPGIFIILTGNLTSVPPALMVDVRRKSVKEIDRESIILKIQE